MSGMASHHRHSDLEIGRHPGRLWPNANEKSAMWGLGFKPAKKETENLSLSTRIACGQAGLRFARFLAVAASDQRVPHKRAFQHGTTCNTDQNHRRKNPHEHE